MSAVDGGSRGISARVREMGCARALEALRRAHPDGCPGEGVVDPMDDSAAVRAVRLGRWLPETVASGGRAVLSGPDGRWMVVSVVGGRVA